MKRILIINKCNFCKEEFAPTPGNVKKGNGRYCSYICARKGSWSKPKYREHMSKAHKGNIPSNMEQLIAYRKSDEGRKLVSERLKGSTPWNKGLTGKQVGWSKGLTKELDIRLVKISGENNWNWKGGKYTENYRERRRFQREIQKSVFERDNYTCQLCYIRGGILHVDHIQSFAKYLEGRFDINNCRTLCVGCHYKVTFGREMPLNNKWGRVFKKEAPLAS